MVSSKSECPERLKIIFFSLFLGDNVPSVRKWDFLLMWQFLSDEVEITLWESQTQLLKLFKSKVCHKHFRKFPWGQKQIPWTFGSCILRFVRDPLDEECSYK